MNINFSGQNYEVTETEKEQIAEGLAKLERHLGALDAVHVYFTKVRYLINAEIHVSSHSTKLIGTGSTRDALISIDEAIDHLIKQSERLKKKRRDSRTNGKGKKDALVEEEAPPAPKKKEQPEEPVVKEERAGSQTDDAGRSNSGVWAWQSRVFYLQEHENQPRLGALSS